MDKETLRKFYFSGASNFGAFANKATGKSNTSTAISDTNISVSNVDVSVSSAVGNTSTTASPNAGDAAGSGNTSGKNDETTIKLGSTMHTVSTKSNPNSSIGRVIATLQPTGSANHISAIRSIAQQSALQTLGGKGSKGSIKSAHEPPPDAASAEYFAFLRQQQEIQRYHTRIVELINTLEESRRGRQSDINKARHACREILRDIEENADWKLRSKYDVNQLLRDGNLSLQPAELVPDVEADVQAVASMSAHLEGLKGKFKDTLPFAPYALMVDQALRRLSLLEGSLKEGNSDFTPVARLADTMLVQLSGNCELPPVESLISAAEERIDECTCLVEDMRAKREAAIADGEVNVAEKLCYDIIDKYEALVAEVIAKARSLEANSNDTAVIEKVARQYHAPIAGEMEKIRTRVAKLRARCEDDIKKMFALREKVEEVEAATAAKVAKDIEASDRVLLANVQRTEEVFVKIAELERELEELETERHREMQRRLTEKDKDEHRRAEFAKFIATVDFHLVPLERTIKNADIMTHGSEVMEELINNGFNTIVDDLRERAKLLRTVRVEAHKEHVEVFRALLLELGEIIYRKERMMGEIDKKIQEAHIQQELLAETFNPNAKKFGDMKKTLLASRDELEEDVEHLKKRAEAALDAFKYTEDALAEAGVEFVHPVAEQEHHMLALRSKMIEYRAMVVGHCQGASQLMEEIGDLQAAVEESKQEIDELNSTTTGTVSRSVPLIRAANKTRLGI